MRHRIKLQRYTTLEDSNGGVYQDPNTGEVPRQWVTYAEVWAAIEPLSAREFIQSQQMQSEVVARIVIREREGVDAADRIVHERPGRADRVYNIHGILPDTDSGFEYLTMPVSLGVNLGQ